ncbi:hypothetical protein C0081_00470 [Cohaesibacter celericrescens]|uniref:Uncharacterized protein n=1 Tax=Cohaesibacter celericrescens TaxID=2067669 RepID=A0A2N5XW59_9HYPH|nr:hypothetical protein C0081_00470 [Cohaesibacter celericrescens]
MEFGPLYSIQDEPLAYCLLAAGMDGLPKRHPLSMVLIYMLKGCLMKSLNYPAFDDVFDG